jgi:hypothetical protein
LVAWFRTYDWFAKLVNRYQASLPAARLDTVVTTLGTNVVVEVGTQVTVTVVVWPGVTFTPDIEPETVDQLAEYAELKTETATV